MAKRGSALNSIAIEHRGNNRLVLREYSLCRNVHGRSIVGEGVKSELAALIAVLKAKTKTYELFGNG